MALIKCSECDKEISDKAETCPSCGAPIVKPMGQQKVGCGSGCLIIFIALSVFGFLINDDSSSRQTLSPSQSTTREKAKPIIGKIKETIKVGYTSYCVWKVWWANGTSDNQYMNQKPDAMFLFIELTVRNDDKKARNIPPFKLIDENGNEYNTSSKTFGVKNAFSVLEELNPSVSKQGVVLFDVPQNRKYKLKVSGGYWSDSDMLIEIN